MKRRIALVGLGMAVTPHAKSLVDLKDRVEVAYAFSPSARRRAAFGSRFDFPLVDNLETILADRSVDAVMLLTPPNTHLELVERCAKAGKHVLLEKPLEISTVRAEQLVSIMHSRELRLGVVLQHRFRPAVEKMRTVDLGEIVSASCMIPVWRPQKGYYDQPGRGTRARDGGGVLLTQGIHTLDVFLSLVPEMDSIRSFSTTTPVHQMESEDLVAAALKFKNGALGVVHATTAAYPGYPERIELIGTKGTALLQGSELHVRFHDGSKLDFATHFGAGGTGADPMAFPHDWHRSVLSDFLDALDQNREPRASGAEALKVHRFIDRLLAER